MKESDLLIEIYRPPGHITPVTVRVTHLPTGNSATATHDSGLQAKANALDELAQKLDLTENWAGPGFTRLNDESAK